MSRLTLIRAGLAIALTIICLVVISLTEGGVMCFDYPVYGALSYYTAHVLTA